MSRFAWAKALFQAATLTACGSLVVQPITTAAAFATTTTPIQHVVVIFQENVSFDHYFATYPNAANSDPSEPQFTAKSGTPTVNGLTGALLTKNPNGVNPFRFSRAQAATCDQDHNYTDEETAFDFGVMDNFLALAPSQFCTNNDLNEPNEIMGYFDGNTVTAIWNYAQNFAMNDNSFSTTFGPSTPGALNLAAGNTFGAISGANNNPHNKPAVAGDIAGGSAISDGQPSEDVCTTRDSFFFASTSKNIGDLLKATGITWGWFQGGFDLTVTNSNGTKGCARTTTSAVTGVTKVDYIPHHEPFQYFVNTRNPSHARPTSVAAIGSSDAANHQYDLHDFFDATDAGNMPQVAFLKAAGYQDGHAQYSDPLDEQTFLVNTLNYLQKRPEWKNTAVFILYDDSDGWYDHQMSPIVHQSQTSADTLTGAGLCGSKAPADGEQGRCGYGPRQPFMAISRYAKKNFVDDTLTDQSSVIRFIEDNFGLGQIGGGSADAYAGSVANMFDFSHHEDDDRTLILDPGTGEPRDDDHGHDSHHS
jgi:phospholipase C